MLYSQNERIEYKGVDLGFNIDFEKYLNTESEFFKKKYWSAKNNFLNGTDPLHYLVNLEKNNIRLTLCKIGLWESETAKYKAAQTILRYQVLNK